MNPRLRRLWVPTLSTLAMLVVLIGLGTWQMRRLAWKRGVLADIAAAEAALPVPLPAHPGRFAKVAVHGRLLADRAVLFGAEVRDAAAGPVLGGQLIVPLDRAGEAPVLIDLGWVPADARATTTMPGGEVTIVGYVRPPEHAGWFAAPDDPAARRFYTLDPAVIGAALGLSHLAPFTIVALGPTPPAGWPDPAHHLPRPPNNHLQYAVTWYGLAAALLVVFALYVRKGWRS